MIKLLFLVGSLGGGGAEKILVDTVNALNPTKYDITVTTIVDEGIHKAELSKNIKYKSIVRCRNELLKKIFSYLIAHFSPGLFLYNTFVRKIGKYDYEVAFLEGLPTKVLSYSRTDAVRYAWVHTNFDNNFDSLKCFKNELEYQNCYRNYDQIICVSTVAREGFIHKFGNIFNTRVIYNPLDEKQIIAKSFEEADLFANNHGLNIVTVGRLVEQKGYDRLVQAAARLKTNGYQFRIYIIGEGKEKEKLDSMIKQKHLEQVVFLKGYMNNPYPYIKNADLFVCSSREEGFSTVVTEALILGTPVITTECAGMRELFGGTECGEIVHNSTDGIYEGLIHVLKNNELLIRYKDEAVKRGVFFKIQERIRELETLFE